jgi:hypothetical protein
MEPKNIAALIDIVISAALRGEIDPPTMKTLLKALHGSATSTDARIELLDILHNESMDSMLDTHKKMLQSRVA